MDNNKPELKTPAPHTDLQIICFVIALCVACGLLLAVLAYSLRPSQQEAKAFDESKQMLIAARILTHAGFFELLTEEGTYAPARFSPEQQILIPDPNPSSSSKASDEEIKHIATSRIRALLTDDQGALYTLEEKGISLAEYINSYKTSGYGKQPLKLLYAILPNSTSAVTTTSADVVKNPKQVSSFVIPISGFGLWAPIYGFLAIKPDGDTIIGTTWYEHAETPGLGANITEPWWQKQFYEKVIFQESSDGKTDFTSADLGIIVVKGKVRDVFGTSPKSKSAVDGMSGATLTGDGVTAAYRNSLSPYRPFLIKLHEGK